MQAIVESGLWPSTLTTIPSLYVSQQVLGGTELVWPFCKVFEIITGASKKDYFVRDRLGSLGHKNSRAELTGSKHAIWQAYGQTHCNIASFR